MLAGDAHSIESASQPEVTAFNALRKAGKVPGVDFSFQTKMYGGRIEKGGKIIDFLFINPSDLAINIQGIYYHYEQGAPVIQSDVHTRAFMASEGTTLIFIDEDDILDNADYYVREALEYRDHSRLGTRGI